MVDIQNYLCISDAKSMPPNVPTQSPGFEGIDHFDGDLVQSEQSQLSDKRDESIRFGDEDGNLSRERRRDDGSDGKNSPETFAPEKFERLSREVGERQSARRKVSGSWADEAEDLTTEEEKKTFLALDSADTDGGQSSRKDDGRGANQYSRQDRRKCALGYDFVDEFAAIFWGSCAGFGFRAGLETASNFKTVRKSVNLC